MGDQYMRMKYAAVAALSTVASLALFSAPALADPAGPHPAKDPQQLRTFKPAQPSSKVKRALAAEDGWVQTVRDGITLDSRSTAITTTPAKVTRANTRSDFDGDGKDDISAASDDGVIVTYSSAPHRDQFRVEQLDEDGCATCLGNSLVSGNFNGDGYDDLAISDLFELDTTNGTHAGAVWIFYGGPDGLQISTVQHITENTAGVPGTSEEGDKFGGALAAGDITGDGKDDLAVGLPDESLGSATLAGGVIVFKGSTTGVVTGTGALWIDQNSSGVPGTAETDDGFGWALTIGKVNTDKYADLIIGTPFENYTDGGTGSGMLTQFWGSAAGVSLTGVTSISGESVTSAAKTTGEYVFLLGLSTAIGDLNKDGYGDIVVGAPYTEVNWLESPGAVVTIPGRGTGLSTSGAKVISQNTSGVSGSSETDDYFGDSIAVGDVTGDGYADVVTGAPGEAIGTLTNAGLIAMLRGSSSGLTGTNSQSLDQSSSLVPGSAETNDYFADSVDILNLDGKGTPEILAGSPGEEVTGDTPGYGAGTLTTFPTSSAGMATGTTTSGRAVVPAGDTITGYAWNLVARQG
jgi:hypothetical protein